MPKRSRLSRKTGLGVYWKPTRQQKIDALTRMRAEVADLKSWRARLKKDTAERDFLTNLFFRDKSLIKSADSMICSYQRMIKKLEKIPPLNRLASSSKPSRG